MGIDIHQHDKRYEALFIEKVNDFWEMSLIKYEFFYSRIES